MSVKIESGLTDDNDFVALVSALVKNLLIEQSPQQIWIIHINNWFDHKWLGFSGNGIFANPMFAGVSDRFDSVKVEFSQSGLTFPPFSPDRVLGQWSFLESDGRYVEFPLPAIPHDTQRIHSEKNLHRRIEDFSSSACFVWYSGNTLKNGRGSVMVYTVTDSAVDFWFASFRRKEVWALTQTKNISREKVLRLLVEVSIGPPLD